MNLLGTRLFKILFTLLGALFIGQGAMAQCGYQSPPVGESFDTSTMPPGCWTTKIIDGSSDWESGQQGDPGFGASSATEHTGNGGYFAWVDFSSVDTTALVSDKVDVSGMSNTPKVRYWFFSNNTDNPSENNTLALQAYDGSSWQTIITHMQNDPSWQSNSADLSPYIFNDTVQVRFVAMVNPAITAFYDDILLDDIEITSCAAPSNLNATALSNDSIEVDWTSLGSGTEWELIYGQSGFTPGTGDTLTSTNSGTMDTITGLAGNDTVTYDIYVREICGSGDTSIWVGPVTETTPCTEYSTPYMTGFEGDKWTPGSPGIISGCWMRTPTNTSDFMWMVNDGSTPSSGTGPNDDVSGGGNYLFTEGSSGSSGDSAQLYTPWIDASGLTIPEFRFDYHFYGVEIDSFFVAVDTGNGWSDLDTIVGEQQTDNSDPYKRWQRYLPSFSDDTVRFAFTALRGGGYQCDHAIDSVVLEEAPSCPQPENLQAMALNEDSVQISWDDPIYGPNSEWQIEYGPEGFAQGTGDSLDFDSNPDTLTGLSGNNITSYDIYIRQVCGAGDTSAWAGPVNAITPCPSVFAAPYLEGFDTKEWVSGTGFDNTGGMISSCWARDPVSAGSNFFWGTRMGPTSTGSTGPDGDHPSGSGKYLYTEASNGSTGDTAYLSTPWIDVTPLSLPQMSYFYHFYGSDIDSFTVEVDSGSGWNGLDTLIGQKQANNSANWSERAQILSNYTNDTIRFRFRALKGGTNSDYAIDSFMVKEAPACPQPIGFNATAINGDSVALDWTSNGLGTEWQITYDTAGFALGTGDTITIGNTTDTITGLDPTTEYDFYVREVCSPSDSSVWVGPLNVITPCLDSYTAVYRSGFDKTSTDTPLCWSKIDPGANIEITNTTDQGYSPTSGSQLVTFNNPNGDTNMLISPRLTDLPAGDKQIRFNVKPEETSFGDEFFVIGTMSDPSNSATWTPYDTIKANELSFTSWEEVTIKLNDLSSIGSDEHIAFMHADGDIYEMFIDDLTYEFIPDTNVALQQITRPISKCDMDPDSITVRVSNEGTQPQSGFDIAYTIDGGAPVVETVSQTIQPFNSTTYTFAPTSGLAGDGTYEITAYTSLNGDTINMNDTSSVQVVNSSGSLIPASNPNKGIPTGDTLIEDTLFICGANNEVYECGRILSLTIDSLSHEDALDELEIQLVSPNGTVLNLWMQLGAVNEQGMNNLVFTDTASQNITAATGDPYTGAWNPQEAPGFAKFNGDDLNGMWRLRIFNDDGLDTANFKGWNMRAIDPQRPQPDLGPDTTICQRENLLLDPGNDPDWSYLWGDNSTDSSKAVAGSFLDTNTTYTYNVTVKDESEFNKCSNSDTIDVTIENCTGIEDQNGGKLSFKVHPNPATDQLKIQSEGAQGANFRYELMDLQGKTLVSKRNGGAQGSTMDVSALSKGVYILKGYRSDDQKPLFQQKVIVQ